MELVHKRITVGWDGAAVMVAVMAVFRLGRIPDLSSGVPGFQTTGLDFGEVLISERIQDYTLSRFRTKGLESSQNSRRT